MSAIVELDVFVYAERARSAYYASTSRGSSSSSARGGYSYHHNVNTDWTQSYYNNSSYGGYTSRLSEQAAASSG